MDIARAEQVLGLEGDYDAEDVKKAVRDKIKMYHPDLCEDNGMSKAEAEALTMEVNRAKECVERALARNAGGTTRASAASAPRATDSIPVESPSTPDASGEPAGASGPRSRPGECPNWARALVNGVYYGPFLVGPGVALILLVIGWSLPFFLFGGLNIVPGWQGLYEADGVQFAVFYFGLPIITLANLLAPVHFLNYLVKIPLMLLCLPLKLSYRL